MYLLQTISDVYEASPWAGRVRLLAFIFLSVFILSLLVSFIIFTYSTHV